jgi:hypothetical protein
MKVHSIEMGSRNLALRFPTPTEAWFPLRPWSPGFFHFNETNRSTNTCEMHLEMNDARDITSFYTYIHEIAMTLRSYR